ncbi:type 1 glutamine amidotransferase domain-containing protein [Streptomyces sp. NPDC002004]
MRIAFLVAPDGVEQVELTEPWRGVRQIGGLPELISTTSGQIRAFHHLDPAGGFPVDHALDAVRVAEYAGLVLPGGVANPDFLRMDKRAVAFTKGFFAAGKPVAAICHAPWLLVEADVVRGRTLTSWPSLRTDIRNAGGTWVDQEVVVDRDGPNALITSRRPADLKTFCEAVLAEFASVPATA